MTYLFNREEFLLMSAFDAVIGLIIAYCISESEVCFELFLLFLLIMFLDFFMSKLI